MFKWIRKEISFSSSGSEGCTLKCVIPLRSRPRARHLSRSDEALAQTAPAQTAALYRAISSGKLDMVRQIIRQDPWLMR